MALVVPTGRLPQSPDQAPAPPAVTTRRFWDELGTARATGDLGATSPEPRSLAVAVPMIPGSADEAARLGSGYASIDSTGVVAGVIANETSSSTTSTTTWPPFSSRPKSSSSPSGFFNSFSITRPSGRAPFAGS